MTLLPVTSLLRYRYLKLAPVKKKTSSCIMEKANTSMFESVIYLLNSDLGEYVKLSFLPIVVVVFIYIFYFLGFYDQK